MLVGKRGHLRQVGDAQDLAGLRQRLQLAAYGFGRPSADSGIDLVKDQGGGRS